MKTYPTIDRQPLIGKDVYAFAKIDGSNIRVEWSRKKGFYKFGSRKRLLGTDQAFIAEAEDIAKSQFEQDLTDIFKKNGWDRVISFFEFAGDNSFAGTHVEEVHNLYLIDVSPHKQGILPPRDFVDLFGDLNIAELLYHGKCDDDFVKSVIYGDLEGMPLEGVVCKAKHPKRSLPFMCKIKTLAWIEKLREYCKTEDGRIDENKYNMLL